MIRVLSVHQFINVSRLSSISEISLYNYDCQYYKYHAERPDPTIYEMTLEDALLEQCDGDRYSWHRLSQC